MYRKKTAALLLTILFAALTTAGVFGLIVAFSAYEDRGNLILVETADPAAVFERLNAVDFPYDAEEISSGETTLLYLRARVELTSVMEELLAENAPSPVYRDAHRKLFFAVVFSVLSAGALCVAVGGLLERRAGKTLLRAAAFGIVVGGMLILLNLPLTL